MSVRSCRHALAVDAFLFIVAALGSVAFLALSIVDAPSVTNAGHPHHTGNEGHQVALPQRSRLLGILTHAPRNKVCIAKLLVQTGA